MARPMIGRIVRRLRQERGMTQGALAAALGISASYMNLIESDQRAVTASLVFKLADALGVDLAVLSGQAEGRLEAGLREAFRDPLLGADAVPDEQVAALTASAPDAARAVLALWRAWRVAREDSAGIALPSGRRMLLPAEESRDAFHDAANHFPALESAAESLRAGPLGEPGPHDVEPALVARLRVAHGLSVEVAPLDPGTSRRHDRAAGRLLLAESLPRESRAFHLAFKLALLECREAVESALARMEPSGEEAAAMLRIGLLNYAAGAVLMPYAPYREAARSLRHDVEALCARFGVSWEQACHRLSTLQREGARGVPFFFLRVDPAGNVSKRFSAAGFPFARGGGSCARWVPHAAFAAGGRPVVQVAELPDGAAFLCVARAVSRPAPWGEPPPVHAIALGCDLSRAGEVVYADGLDLARSRVGIGLSCRLCDRPDCRSRAFPPLAHRLLLDPAEAGVPYRFEPRRGGTVGAKG